MQFVESAGEAICECASLKLKCNANDWLRSFQTPCVLSSAGSFLYGDTLLDLGYLLIYMRCKRREVIRTKYSTGRLKS